jgi:hypothetical protein
MCLTWAEWLAVFRGFQQAWQGLFANVLCSFASGRHEFHHVDDRSFWLGSFFQRGRAANAI